MKSLNACASLALLGLLSLVGCGGVEDVREPALETAERSVCTTQSGAPTAPPECQGRCVEDAPTCSTYYRYFCDATQYVGYPRCAVWDPLAGPNKQGGWAFTWSSCSHLFNTMPSCQ